MRRHWVSSPGRTAGGLFRKFRPPLIVRSSAPTEDCPSASQAGRYLSVGSVTTPAQLHAAIDAVFASYDRAAPDDVLFVQEMLTGGDCVGVAFSADPETGSPYLIVNYAQTDRTDEITSGRALHSTWVALGRGVTLAPLPALKDVPAVIAEIQDVCGIDNVDVEFVVKGGRIHVLQVRELAVKATQPPAVQSLSAATAKAVECVGRLQACGQGLVGRLAAFGVMPDWNPAEIIGIRPRPLAVSMYRTLITDRHWSIRRGEYGYRVVSDVPLLKEVLGSPYIDVRASFNSLTPAKLSDDLAGAFVDAALERLLERRELHDKVEFGVMPTCYTADLEVVVADRFQHSLSETERVEITEAIRDLTRGLLKSGQHNHAEEANQIARLQSRRAHHAAEGGLAEIEGLLTDAADLGVNAFVGQARRAFIAIDILRSLVRTGGMSHERFAELLASVETVAGRFQRDKSRLQREDLLLVYGHLRPGTYDITAPRYDHFPDGFLTARQTPRTELVPFLLEPGERRAMKAYLSRLGSDLDPEALVSFMTQSIAAREEGKFEFTKNISSALELIARTCTQLGFSRDDASFLRLPDFFDSAHDAQQMGRIVSDRRTAYAVSSTAKLPMLIGGPDELWSFSYSQGVPNYIGSKTIMGAVVQWPTNRSLDNAVLLIENADPGFDWIFGTNIAGFVTMFGGPNSHMAIRAHELGITAAIGAGPTLFRAWSQATLLRVDPSNQKAEAVP